jgi:molecular chaperone GrpE (heat shock protein)
MSVPEQNLQAGADQAATTLTSSLEPLSQPTTAAPVATQLAALTALVEGKLADALIQRAAFDRLYADFDACRKGEALALTLPWINGLIRVHDNLGRTRDALGDDDTAANGPATLAAGQLAGVQDEIEILMENNGVTVYRDPEPRFQSKRQSVVALVPTADPADDGLIAARLRPGFERGGQLLRKEKVNVYKFDPSLAPTGPTTADPAIPSD